MRRTVATSRSNSIGLVSNSLHPAASAFSRSPASACADSAMMGISRVCGLPLSLREASQPSTTGISSADEDETDDGDQQHRAPDHREQQLETKRRPERSRPARPMVANAVS